MISPLVDIELLPASHPSSVLAVDKTGNLLYCASGEIRPLLQLANVPDPVWGEITTMTIDQGILYLLDNPIIASGYMSGRIIHIQDEPRLFFNDQVPQLNDVVDMVANNEDLYLLHENGMMTTCIFRSFSLPKPAARIPPTITTSVQADRCLCRLCPVPSLFKCKRPHPPIHPCISWMRLAFDLSL
jgi:hypothetical protein